MPKLPKKGPQPWSEAKRRATEKKIAKAAAKATREIGAASAVVIAFFPEGDVYHRQVAGQSPMPLAELFEQLYMMYAHHNIVRVQVPGGGPDDVQDDEDFDGLIN